MARAARRRHRADDGTRFLALRPGGERARANHVPSILLRARPFEAAVNSEGALCAGVAGSLQDLIRDIVDAAVFSDRQVEFVPPLLGGAAFIPLKRIQA